MSNSIRTLNGGQALAEMMKIAEVGPMFGMGGFQLLPFYDAARRLGLPHHLINDERAAVFVADAYARCRAAWGCRRDARAGRDQPGDRPGRGAERGLAAGRY